MMDMMRNEELPDAVARMVRLQQGLLAAGFAYALGDIDTWPRGPVVLLRDDRYVVLAYADLDNPTAVQGLWHRVLGHVKSAGMILVGDASVDDPRVQTAFAAIGGTVAYLDPAGHVALRSGTPTPPELFAEATFPTFLAAVRNGQGAEIDAGAVLRTQMTAAERTPARAGIPWLTYGFIALCVLIAAIDFLQPKDPATHLSAISTWGILYGPWVRGGEWYRLLSHGVLHGGVIHLFMNMLALYFIGPMLEAWQGRGRLALIFAYSVLLGGILCLLIDPTTPSLGASGGLFGLLGAIGAILVRYGPGMAPDARKGMTTWLLRMLAINAFISMMPGIAWMAHLGGLVGGFALTWLIARPPGEPQPISAPRWAAVAGVLLVTVFLAMTVIGRIPLPQ